MSIKSTIQVPLGDDFVECSVSLPASIGSSRISQFSSRVSAAVYVFRNMTEKNTSLTCHRNSFDIANDIDSQADRSTASTPSQPEHNIRNGFASHVVSIQLRGADDGFTVWFKVNRQSTLRRVMETYARQAGRSIKRMSFVFDSERIHHSYTADSVSTTNC